MTRIYIFAVLFALLVGTCAAQTPDLVGTTPLSGQSIGYGLASADGKRFVTVLSGKNTQPSRLQVIDTSDPQHPKALGSLPVAAGTWALSDDGALAVFIVATARPQYGKDIAHDVIAIDLKDPNQPRELWRKKIEARAVAVSSSANAYAYSSSIPGNPGQAVKWRTTVEYVNGQHPVIAIDDPQYSRGALYFSPHADFLVSPELSFDLYEWDLRGKEPRLIKQDGGGYQRYACISTVLDSGHVMVKDRRAPRFGIYRPTERLPRLSTLTYDVAGGDTEEYCKALNPGSTDGTYLYLDNSKRIRELNLKKLAAPSLGSSWQLPPDTYAQAVAKNLLFAVAGNEHPELRIYRLDGAHSAVVNWPALSQQHAEIMRKYTADVKAQRPLPYFDALGNLERAGVLLAIDAQVDGISAQNAAVILNDYGFLAAKRGISAELVEHVLQRSIELDPQRALAHLNLADFLRAHISDYAVAGRETGALHHQIVEHYRAYLALGGKSNKRISEYLQEGSVLTANGGDVCKAIAASANAGRLDELVAEHGVDVPYKGKKIDLIFTTEGTAHVPAYYAYDSATDFPLADDDMPAPPPGAEEAWGGDSLGLLSYNKQAYLLFYRDMQHPTSSVSLADGSQCRFSTTTVEKIGGKAAEPALCTLLQQGKGPKIYEFVDESPMDQEAISHQWGESSINGTHVLDISNSGQPVNVAELGMSSGAGAGCEETFYEVVNANATAFVGGVQRDLLMQLQNAMPDNRYPILPCGNQPSFFTYKNRIYFETKPAVWPPVDKWNQYHRVTTIDGGKVREVCDFQFETTVRPAAGKTSD